MNAGQYPPEPPHHHESKSNSPPVVLIVVLIVVGAFVFTCCLPGIVLTILAPVVDRSEDLGGPVTVEVEPTPPLVEETQPEPEIDLPDEPGTPPRVSPAGTMVRVAILDDTASNPVHPKAEIWFRGRGSVFLHPEITTGSMVRDLGRRPVGDVLTGDESIQFYPEGRDGPQINIPIKLTPEMNPNGSDRDRITIDIGDAGVTVHGLAVKAATGMSEFTARRGQRSR